MKSNLPFRVSDLLKVGNPSQLSESGFVNLDEFALIGYCLKI
jgi:hypothetical protein